MEHWTKIKNGNFACCRVILFIGAVAASMVSGYVGGGSFYASEVAVSVVVTMFAILSGFLLAILAVIGSSDMLLDSATSRHARVYRVTVKARFIRFGTLFSLYLTALILITSLVTFKGLFATGISLWISRCALFMVTLSLMCSYSIPISLYAMYMERYDRKTRIIEKNERNRDAQPPSH